MFSWRVRERNWMMQSHIGWRFSYITSVPDAESRMNSSSHSCKEVMSLSASVIFLAFNVSSFTMLFSLVLFMIS